MNPIVVVLGGNAFMGRSQSLSMEGQLTFAAQSMAYLRPLIDDNIPLLISHGNGPQVGHILTRVEQALGKAYALPLEVCVAESEGELGYVLVQSLYNLFAQHQLSRKTACLLTQVVVEKNDQAFTHPTKPIGAFYSRAEADRLTKQGMDVVEEIGRGFRRVVPSPVPIEIVELDIIRKMLELNLVVIAAGGGGIPVIRERNLLSGVEAVVDKDLTAALMASQLEADLLVILTCVPCAYKNYGTPNQQPIGLVTTAEAQQLLEQKHFAPGSMRPKIEAAITFAGTGGRKVIICDPPSLEMALEGKAGTIVKG